MRSQVRIVPVVSAFTVVLVAAAGALATLQAPAHAAHRAQHTAPRGESHAFGLAAPTHGAAGRHAWGGWIGSWKTADGQIVYHLDPGARSGRATFGPAGSASTLTYRGRPVAPANAQQAAWILSRYGAVPNPSQSAAVELAVDELLLGGRYGLAGTTTKARLMRLDDPTRVGVVRLANQMIRAAQQGAGYTVHVSKAGTSDGASTPVTATDAIGHLVPRAQVTVSGSSPLAGWTGPQGEAAVIAVPQGAAPQHLDVTVSVPDTTLVLRAPTQRQLSRAAVAGVRGTVTGSATLTAATAWTLTYDQHYVTPASDTRTWETLYSGTFADAWTCSIPQGSTFCTDPSGDPCSHNVGLNSGPWGEFTSVPPNSYRSGNTCVWRTYTATSSRQVQTGGTYTPAADGWQPVTDTYADGTQAAAALTTCQAAPDRRSCMLSDNATVS